jgi:hypothetical protein
MGERKLTHVELIQPMEKIDPRLGGTGYLPPTRPATIQELADAVRRGQIVWKVLQTSVNWRRPASSRRLQMAEAQIKCKILGGTRQWWFVHVID